MRIEDKLADALAESCGRRPEREYKFCPERAWAFDLAFPSQKLAVEVNGQHHLRHGQHRKDCEKINAAVVNGWRVLQYPASCVVAQCRLPLIVEQITRALCGVQGYDFDEGILTKRAA